MKGQFFILILLLASHLSFSQIVEREKYDSSLGLNFDNDFYFKTDKYYSAGESIFYVGPIVSSSPFARFLISTLNIGDVVHYGLNISHKIFTPTRPADAGSKYGDRPFSASLDLTHFAIVENKEFGYRVESALKLGVFGKHAYGMQLQSFIHDITPSGAPIGWENQLNSDVIINYKLGISKSVFSSKYIELLGSANLNLGTIENDISLSPTLRFGKMDNFFESFSVTKKSNLKYWVELSYTAKIVAYNAYLQGGLINSENIYSIQSSEIERLNHFTSLKLYLEYYRHRLIFSQNSMSPEFRNGVWHNWIGIEYQFWF